MSSQQSDVLLFVLPFALLISAVAAAFQDWTSVGGMLLVGAGLLSMLRCSEMAATQNRLYKTGWRFLLGGGGSVVRPQLYLLWGIGLNAVGVGWLIAG